MTRREREKKKEREEERRVKSRISWKRPRRYGWRIKEAFSGILNSHPPSFLYFLFYPTNTYIQNVRVYPATTEQLPSIRNSETINASSNPHLSFFFFFFFSPSSLVSHSWLQLFLFLFRLSSSLFNCHHRHPLPALSRGVARGSIRRRNATLTVDCSRQRFWLQRFPKLPATFASREKGHLRFHRCHFDMIETIFYR